ncbi:hypothetical protein SUGI_0127580 [Cryptomeria japonica]|uniref:ethylene-responsive transcription factor ERF011 n=1 Tax=Cryptomeria japonica TaxID=3369 RepID=UPI002408A3FD|nr:ethylene-responsive transcription factor ERF011 [Cryptomeria japonica]GLJ10404.1 hypothetical protein SUGI_0127580 [Cryptomeria japonica]
MVKSKSSPKQNHHNCLHQTQNLKGVRMRKWGKWVSEVRVPNSRARIWLGSYDSPQQAARAYDCAVYCLRGSQAKFNFPDSLPEIPSASSLSPAQIQSVAAKFAREEFLQVPDYGAKTFSGSESQSCVDEQQISEEQDWALLDSLLQDIESSHSKNLEDFLLSDEGLLDKDFLLFEEKQEGFLSSKQTEDWWDF